MRLVIVSLASFVSMSAALAQVGNPGGMAPGTRDRPAAAAQITNTADQLFVRLAGSGGLAEVDFGMLAGKSGNSDVKAFGRRMADDHSKANLRLADAAKKANLEVPKQLDAEHQAIRAKLSKAGNEARFDLDYVSNQIGDHIKTVQLLEWEINSGQNADIQHFASETLPTVLDHLRMAQDLLVKLRSQPSH
jgi:putative membrane protein